MVRLLPRTSKLWIVGLIGVLVVAVVVFMRSGGYTPTTTAYVQNDTATSVTLDDCADNAVTVAPAAREQISPFKDAAHGACTVFAGGSDLGRPIGCLYIPSANGHTISGAVVRVSAMRPTTGRSSCR